MKRFLLFFLLLALTGCVPQENTETANIASHSFTDDEGREINVEKPYERIISFYSAHTENIYFLGKGDSLIGGHTTCTYPEEAKDKAKFDYKADPENVIAQNPDLILIRPFISSKAPDFVSAIENAGIQVVSLYPESLEDFDDYIKKLAILTGSENDAEKLLNDFHNELSEISELTSKAKVKTNVFFEATEDNLRTVTADSMAGLAIETAGGNNIAKNAVPAKPGSSIASYGIENVLINADIIDVYISQKGSMNSGGDIESIKKRPAFDTIKAVKENRVYVIDEKIISSPTFRYTQGVRQIAKYLYPDLIK